VAVAAERKKTLLEMKALLETGPLNWTDTEIKRIAAFTSIPESDLSAMRHKMLRASEWSVRDLTALDDLIRRSKDPARLRKQIERDTSVQQGIEKAKTYTGLFNRIKRQVDSINAELARRK
jgi:hypothetical protein